MTILDQNGHWSKSGRLTSGFGVVLDPGTLPGGSKYDPFLGHFLTHFWVILAQIR
jgi:hypothetical protein